MLDEPRGHVAKVRLSTYLVAAVAKCYLPCIRHTRPGHPHTHTHTHTHTQHRSRSRPPCSGSRRAKSKKGSSERPKRPSRRRMPTFCKLPCADSQSPCLKSVGGPGGATESRRRSRGGKVEGQIDEPFLHMLVQSSPCSHSPLVPVRFVQMKACIQ